METLQRVALALTIIGALNWGLVGFLQFDVVAELAGGSTEPIARLIFILIGVSGLINLSLLFKEWQGDKTLTLQKAAPEKI